MEWFSLGLSLGLRYPTLEAIDIDYRGNVRRCRTEMLAAWLKQEDNVRRKGGPTWTQLRDAVKDLNGAIAHKIQQQYLSGIYHTCLHDPRKVYIMQLQNAIIDRNTV